MTYQTLIRPAQLADLELDQVLILDCRFNLSDTTRGRLDPMQRICPAPSYARSRGRSVGARPASGLGRHPLPSCQVPCASAGASGAGTAPAGGGLRRCRSGALAAHAWWLFRAVGHTRSRFWTVAGRAGRNTAGPAVAPTTRPAAHGQRGIPGTAAGQARHGQHRSAGIFSGRGITRVLLLDARARERFAGRQEPIDRRSRPCARRAKPTFRRQSGHRGRILQASAPQRPRSFHRPPRRSTHPRQSCTCAARASPPATTCWPWSMLACTAHVCMRRPGAAGSVTRIPPIESVALTVCRTLPVDRSGPLGTLLFLWIAVR